MNSDIWLSLFCKNASVLDLVAFFNKSTVTVNCYEMALKFNLKLQFRSRLTHKGEIFLGTVVAFLFSDLEKKLFLFSKNMIHHSTFFSWISMAIVKCETSNNGIFWWTNAKQQQCHYVGPFFFLSARRALLCSLCWHWFFWVICSIFLSYL